MGVTERRQSIVDAALRVLAVRDVGSVTVEELALAAGASPALVHHYFGDKQGLAEVALGQAADQLVSALAVDPAAHAAVQLDDGLRIYLDFLAAHPAAWSALLRAGAARLEPAHSIARRVDDHAAAIAVRALGLDPPPLLLDLALRGWLELVKATCLTWLERGEPDREALHGFLAGAFVGCVQAAAGADPACAPALERLLS